jgi:hypothetical protein
MKTERMQGESHDECCSWMLLKVGLLVGGSFRFAATFVLFPLWRFVSGSLCYCLRWVEVCKQCCVNKLLL